MPLFACVVRRRSQKKGTKHAVSRERHRAAFQAPCGCGGVRVLLQVLLDLSTLSGPGSLLCNLPLPLPLPPYPFPVTTLREEVLSIAWSFAQLSPWREVCRKLRSCVLKEPAGLWVAGRVGCMCQFTRPLHGFHAHMTDGQIS